MGATGAATLAYAEMHWQRTNLAVFALFVVLAVATSRMKIKLPGMRGAMAMNLPFFLIALAEIDVSEALLVALLGAIAQSFSPSGRAKPVQVMFNAATLINAAALAGLVLRITLKSGWVGPLALMGAALAYFFSNTVPVAIVLWLTEGKRPVATWARMAELSLPFYLLSGGFAAIVCFTSKGPALGLLMAVLVAMYFTYRSYRLYFAPLPVIPASTTSATIDIAARTDLGQRV
jgi:hypothetical protein